MSKFFESIVTSVAALGALTFVATATPASAHTYEYCRRDVIGATLSCSFDTMAQCQAMSSGRGGDCLRDPALGEIGNSYAYAPDRRVKAALTRKSRTR
jgi:hypothetical protein